MSSPANSSLRPAWHRGSQSGGRGFQPPPTVASERVRSSGSEQQQQQQKQQQNQNVNKFAALDDDEDIAAMEQEAEEVAKRVANSRSEALRSAGGGGRSNNSNKPGRSLADLAARVPSRERSASFGSSGERSAGGGANTSSRLTSYVPSSTAAATVNEANIIRFTRERLLSMRPKPLDEPPEQLKILDEQSSIVVAEKAQDPVCWDTFDAEAIWATVPRRSSKVAEGTEGRRVSSRREIGSSNSGRWQRGVALPPQDQSKKSREADNPSDLWDDPQATGAAVDFSAFGAMPAEDEPFDFEKMAEATRKFEEELHGNRSRASSEAESDGKDENPQTRKIDSHRPLASIGTTIQSGSGDNVNVFEDFDDPAAEDDADANENKSAIKSGTEDKSASSRLMAMIGVKKEPETAAASEPTTSAWGAPPEPPKPPAAAAEDAAPVPLNPWGGPLLPGQGEPQPAFDLQARMREAELEKARQQEEAQRRAAAAQQQAEEQARKAASMQQQDGVQSQVELVLMERISTILENSWGQSDLASILSTLHSEDSRVIPLLSNTDALRALILRNPQRIALRSNPVFGTEMAVLLLTTAQWQQHQAAQQQQAALRSQQEELQRQQAQQRQLQQQRQQEKAAAAAAASAVPPIVDGAPWYYSDPQRNIQGPFRGEEMRQWLEAGYFKADLPISQQQTGPFFPLSTIFPDLTVAFVSPRDTAAEQEAEKARIEAERAAEAAKRDEAERHAREAAERERLAHGAAERERQAREEAERRAQKEKKAAVAQAKEAVNESSNQLKMMLGVSGSANVEANEAPAPKEKRGSKGSNKNSQQQQRASDVAPAPQPLQMKQASPSAPAWGGASKPVTRKSMSEIQKEEARAAAIAAMNREGGHSSSSGWANVAASRGGGTVWQGGATQQRPAAVVQMQPAPVAQTRLPQPQIAQVAAANAQLSRSQRSQPASSNAADEFGAKMSPALEKWCKDQMMKLNGTDDLTLVSFCMTLTDPIEIRQYLTTYLGSNAQVNSFATEFINKKSGAKAQEEWESTVVTKKSRKKKSGGR